MKLGAVTIAITVATALGGSLACSAIGREEPAATRTTEGATVTVTKTVTETVIRTIARPDPRAGRRVFATTCVTCHTLEPGDWRGDKVNLADIRPSYRATVEKVTSGGIAMPSFKGKLSEREIRDVAAFVAREARRERRRR